MPAEILIVGQGLAGTLLGWELERAGVAFEVVDAGHHWAASQLAAGIINPITGHNIAKSWRVDTLLPAARDVYQTLAQELGIAVWRDMRVRRLYLNEEERRVFAEKQAAGELAGYVGATDGEGFWIEGAAHVDVPALVAAARERWRRSGRLREECWPLESPPASHALVIVCGGAARPEKKGNGAGPFKFVRWQYSQGECLTGSIDGLLPNVVLNRRFSVLPLSPGTALVGATHTPARCDALVTAEARTTLEGSVTAMTKAAFACREHRAGVRVYVGDKKPVIGRHPADPRLGVFNGLGNKGALLAPALARQWARHVTEGAAFEPEVSVTRLWPGRRAGASSH